MRRHLALGASFLCALVLFGCHERRSLRWQIDVEDDAVRDRIALVRAEIRRGTCAETGERIYTAEPSLGGSVPAVPTLAEGHYAFAATARDASCVVIAGGCENVTLPADPSAIVRTLLVELAPTPPICDDCGPDGRCTGERDAGTDAAADDAGADDAAVPIDANAPGPPPPRLIAPWNGFASGSVLARDLGVTRTPLRPRLAWERVSGATRYEVQLDDGCAPGTPSACDFARGRIVSSDSSARAAGAWVFAPTVDLVTTASRVHWRVRACDATSACGAWSAEVRWMDVGRDRHDVDGDGRGDLLVGAPSEDVGGTNAGVAHLYLGGPSTPWNVETPLALSPSARARFGHAIALGDLDGDGLADAVISASNVEHGSTDAGSLLVLRGTSTGLDTARAVTIPAPEAPWASGFGASVAIVDDTDGDGFREVLVGAVRPDIAGRVYLFRGDASALLVAAPIALLDDPDASTTSRFGYAAAAAYDVDGDGAGDLLIGAPYAAVTNRGRAWVFRASAMSSPIALTGVDEDNTHFGFAVAGLGDADGDGYSDVAVGTPYADGIAEDEGRVDVFGGGPDGVSPTRVLATVARDTGYRYVHAGWSIAAGDVDGDGDVDLVVPEPGIDGDSVTDRGALIVHPGAGNGTFGTPVVLYPDVDQATMQYGRSVAVIDADGDGRAEIVGGAHRWNSASSTDTGRVWWHADPLGSASRGVLAAPRLADSAMFGWALPGSTGHLALMLH